MWINTARLILLLLLSGCALDPVVCAPCTTTCPYELSCIAGRCQSAEVRCVEPLEDAAPGDAAHDLSVDAGRLDASPEAALLDAAVLDAAVLDAAVPDAAVPDAAVPDAGGPDASLNCPTGFTVEAERLWAPNDGLGPPPVSFAAATAFEWHGQPWVALHGGILDNRGSPELWLFDITTNTWHHPTLEPQVSMQFHGLYAVPNTTPPEIWVITGDSCSNRDANTPIKSIRINSVDAATWAPPPELSGIGIHRVYCPSGIAAADGVVWLHGGGEGIVDRLPAFRVDVATSDVKALPAGGPPESHGPLDQTALTYDAEREHLYVLQGAINDGNPAGPTPHARFWRYDHRLSQWADLTDPDNLAAPPIAMGGRAVWLRAADRLLAVGGFDRRLNANIAFSAAHLFEPETEQWQKIVGDPWPSPRWGHALVALPDGVSAWLHGGTAGEAGGFAQRGDVWRLTARCAAQ
jgi:hypothetical protein